MSSINDMPYNRSHLHSFSLLKKNFLPPSSTAFQQPLRLETLKSHDWNGSTSFFYLRGFGEAHVLQIQAKEVIPSCNCRPFSSDSTPSVTLLTGDRMLGKAPSNVGRCWKKIFHPSLSSQLLPRNNWDDLIYQQSCRHVKASQVYRNSRMCFSHMLN